MRQKLSAAILACSLLAAPVFAKKKPMADEFTATLISMEVSAAMGKRVQIWVESYTPDDVAESLVKTLAEGGQRPLSNAIADYRAGTLKIGTSNGYPIAIARQRVSEDGSRLVFLVTNRPMTGFAPMAGARIDDYPFGIIELKLAPDGTGEGTLVGAAQLAYDAEKKSLTLRSNATQPSRLSAVKPAGKK
jgi:hypothetical protein